MEQVLEQIREQQKESWNKFSPGWKKWDGLTMEFLSPMGEEIIRKINPQDGELILDIAAGTGEPGLTIASMIPNGKVVITDLAEDMLTIAKENAEHRGVRNVEFKACDVCELPFNDNTFDAISCRFGFMFFPDIEMAAKEMVRVLKPGGRLATSVWYSPEKNFWITAIMSNLSKHIEMPTPPPGSPGMFRCAKNGMLAGIFENTGLKNVSEKEVPSVMPSGTTDRYWEMMTEVAAPVVAALGKTDEETRAKIKRDVYATVNAKFPDGNVMIDCSALVIYGEK